MNVGHLMMEVQRRDSGVLEARLHRASAFADRQKCAASLPPPGAKVNNALGINDALHLIPCTLSLLDFVKMFDWISRPAIPSSVGGRSNTPSSGNSS